MHEKVNKIRKQIEKTENITLYFLIKHFNKKKIIIYSFFDLILCS
jgi:hypothetical protein